MSQFQTFTPLEYIYIDLANQFGLDKEFYETRIAWAKAHEHELFDLVADADNPNMFYRAALALKDAREGRPTGYFLGFDSMASGIQLLSTLAKCEVGMTNTGVLNSSMEKLPDVYRICTETMDVQGFARKPVKMALMTFFYGSQAEPIKLFGDGPVLDLFFYAAQQVAPEAFDLRDILMNLWQPQALAHTWEMPDGGEVFKRVWNKKDYRIEEPLLGHSFTHVASVNEGKDKGISLVADITHSCDAYLLREVGRRCNFDVVRLNQVKELLDAMDLRVTCRKKVVSLVIADTLDASNIHEYDANTLAILKEQIDMCLRFGSFENIDIHDDFGCSPVHMNKLRKHYNRILFELYHSDLLVDIVKQISGKDLVLNEPKEEIAIKILEANYAIN